MNAFADFAELFSESKILIVDDVEDNRVVLQRQLERHGYQSSESSPRRRPISSSSTG